MKAHKIMYILRGLPGSGKSTISNQLVDLHEKTIICSADDFFLNLDGVYEYNETKKKEAHCWCQEKAKEACSLGNHVIIDNTNVRKWELKFYIDLAKEFGYVTIVIEPETDWKWDPEILSRKNKHKVTKEVLERKLKNYELIRPVYYAWFYNEEDSEMLRKMGKDFYTSAKKVKEFTFVDTTTFEDTFTRDNSSSKFFHCTAKFLGTKQKAKELTNFENFANKFIGSTHLMHITGFLISPRTICAKVELTEEQLKLWDDTDIPNKENQRGSKAHITIGYKKNERAVEAGNDVVKYILEEKNEKAINTITTSEGVINLFKNGLIFLKLKKSIEINGIFAGRY
ncbi:DgyrCDS6028 [Dimorphilus gyrociliatus]|uniref:2',3'-cyclic-nucleotide 3'-phosphodiesterase n=1 Tax=Dimorphilus gyrociliatus TaxID=2664684 RepID=A0A7I8VLR3_9ANNE|nr:DgyrCDS6028 [Dimorphilus gyrociliatus]